MTIFFFIIIKYQETLDNFTGIEPLFADDILCELIHVNIAAKWHGILILIQWLKSFVSRITIVVNVIFMLFYKDICVHLFHLYGIKIYLSRVCLEQNVLIISNPFLQQTNCKT